MEIPKSIWIWIGVIALIKIINIISGFVVVKQFISVHTVVNKITGLLMFVLPLTMAVVELRYSALVVCVWLQHLLLYRKDTLLESERW